jgi:outer membrane immunogenic protein
MKTVLLAAACAIGLASSTMAADMAIKAPPSAPDAVFSWTGFYVGINGGGGFTRDESVILSETFNGAPFISGTWPGSGVFGKRDVSGGFGGGQIGYNWQAGSWVFGIEADAQGSGIRGSTGATLPYISVGNTITTTRAEKLDWFGTVRGRIGTTWDRWLVYGTGGLAYGRTKTSLNMTDTFNFFAATTVQTTRAGYAIGGGVEYALTPNWTVKGEYQYLDLGRRTINVPELLIAAPSAFAVSNSMRYDYHTVRIGVNYKL